MPVDVKDIEDRIRNSLGVTHLEIVDVSSGCGENYAVLIVSESFEGKTTLARHRIVNDLLSEQIAKMHAFSQKTYTPKQYQQIMAKKAAE